MGNQLNKNPDRYCVLSLFNAKLTFDVQREQGDWKNRARLIILPTVENKINVNCKHRQTKASSDTSEGM